LILTLTVNPAIDRNVTVDRLVFEDRSYISNTRESAGGRGLNASMVISRFGGATTAIAVCGGKAGKRLEELLAQAAFPVQLVRIRNEIRTNMTIADRQGLAVKLNELGPELSGAELARLEKAIRANLEGTSWLMLCGSLPPGVPSGFYARLICQARKKNVRTLLDADGPEFLEGIEARPTVVAPNQQEAERILKQALVTRNSFREAAEQIRKMGAESVLLSLGARGAMAAQANGPVLEVVPPRVDAICPIGSGDALAAGFVWASTEGSDFADALRWGVAAGTASALLPGVSFATLEQTRRIYERVSAQALPA
jgi:1-phosphofructokinase family hexose kinase